MIYHASIPAREPRHVAGVLAEIWNGEAMPFVPVPGAFIAMAGDARGSAIEVYPRERVITPGSGGDMFVPGEHPPSSPYVATHLAITTSLSADAIKDIGAREGWRAVRCSRGGMFDVIELWVENALMIEVLTQEMQRDYETNSSIEAWRAVIGHAGAPG